MPAFTFSASAYTVLGMHKVPSPVVARWYMRQNNSKVCWILPVITPRGVSRQWI